MRTATANGAARAGPPLVVPLEAGLGPDNPPCPVCGEPLFGWATRGAEETPVRRCERCGLAVAGRPAGREEVEAAGKAVTAAGGAPNRRSLQAWIGSSGWSAMESGSRFFFTADSLRRLGHEGARPRPAIGAMYQTLLNSFTFGHNVALGSLGRAEAAPAAKSWQRRLDAGISVLATVLVAPIAAVLELAAAACGRGGRLSFGRTGRE